MGDWFLGMHFARFCMKLTITIGTITIGTITIGIFGENAERLLTVFVYNIVPSRVGYFVPDAVFLGAGTPAGPPN